MLCTNIGRANYSLAIDSIRVFSAINSVKNKLRNRMARLILKQYLGYVC
uniref:Uncharacterized protein n=1 Tax=Arundo donax TaxID=35708 RepID=A0A0A8YD03_ARUDO